MSPETLVVVADKFVEFAAGKRAVTASQLRAMIELPEEILPGHTALVRGQGLADTEVVEIVRRIEVRDPAGRRFDVDGLRAAPPRADAKISHKHRTCNTLISRPEKIEEDLYALEVCIDQDCELMGDHQTGQHVQGMILVEAARQAFLAVTETYFPHAGAEKTYFVINSMTTDFLGFVFPLPARIDYRVLEKDINERRQKFRIETDFVQGGEVRTRVGFSFTVYPHEVISSKEAALAQEAFAAAIASIVSDPELGRAVA
ncbi:AfsA-related hotdog domain-containing protein [Salinarimonas ramus]|uniref:A-factor biosynthesis protein AfsA n=1 Tax=Salinarimonas ramus TaxID=690164 RepID=A0A917Q898_9HYPH|nr:AfsA-related hotdog domain-containing protein [Salinarimonas ramus]GGK30757.1 A-factor biosynthesis protein AfsA [Salinarimonas ramus]